MIHGRNVIFVDRRSWLSGGERLVLSGSFPAVGLEKASNVAGRGNLDVVLSL